MFPRVVVAALCALGLSACDPAGASPAPLAPGLKKGLDAYRAGQREAFSAALDEAEGQAEAHPGSTAPCSIAALDKQRLEYAAAVLRHLDKSVVFSMSEEARLLYFDTVMSGGFEGGEETAPPESCGGNPASAAIALKDGVERIAMLKSFASQREAWWNALQAEHPSDMGRRMSAAGKLLVANRLDPPSWVQTDN